MRTSILSSLLLLTACGSGSKDTKPPNFEHDQLLEVMNKVEPELLYCGNVPAELSPNILTGQERCATGDSMLLSGIELSMKGPRFVEDGVRNSITAEGRPYRSPQYRSVPDPENSFSRDQTLGLLLYLVESKDVETAKKVWSYVEKNNYNTCDNDTDGRCFLTPNMLAVFSDVWRYLNIPRPLIMTFNRSLDEETILVEAKTAPKGYQMHLVSLKLWIRIKTGSLTNKYAEAARSLKERTPENLWFRYLDNLTHSGETEEYKSIATGLTECLNKWPGSQRWGWTFSNPAATQCDDTAMGHELVGLGRLLLEKIGE